ncbi:MAG TPA: ABC transporter permease, partial [Terriglobales bacterium]|nr:ABC transporter permease [Terriglobales bacterium]
MIMLLQVGSMLWLDDLVRDLKYGFRMVRSARLISTAVVLTLAVGIGINTGIFTLINGILLRPRTDSDPGTFARLYAQYWSSGNPREFGGQFSPAAYRAIQERSRSLEELAAWRTDHVLIGDDSTTSQALEVSCDFFSVYGLTKPLSGRLFRGSECAQRSEQSVVVLAEGLWRNRFAADTQILGKTILLNRQPFTVIGIVPADFSGRLRSPGIWVPYTMQHRLTGNADIFVADRAPSLWLEGRLRPEQSRDQLAAEVNVIVAQVPTSDPNLRQRVLVTNGAMIEDPIVRARSVWIILLILSGAALLLIVSCASGAVLLLSRAVARQREIAVRISLGAARRRIVRQLLSENLLLAVAAGVLGIYLALEIPKIFRKLVPQMPHYRFTLDWHIFGYLTAITLVACMVAGLTPALESLRQDVWEALKGHETVVQAARQRWNVRDLLVIVQVCFCVVLMVVSVMFSQAVLSLFSLEPGFETRHLLAVPIRFSSDHTESDVEAFYRTLEDRIAAIGQVEDVATSSLTPLAADAEGLAGATEFRLPTQVSAEAHAATVRVISRNYFSTLGIPFLRGEGFPNSESDDSAVIVSQAFAAVFWPRQDPIGQTVLSSEGKRFTVVGVVHDNHTEYTREADGPALYKLRLNRIRGDLVLVRFHGDVASIAAAVKHIVRDLDQQMLVLSSNLRAQMDQNAEQGWLMGKMLLFVAFVAASLALIGIYGVVGYSVTRRTREFGIRTALGATPGDMMQLVFASGLRPVIAGTVVGTAFAFVFSL